MMESYPDVLEIKEVCMILRVGRKTAYKLLKDGQISYRKIGRIYRIPKSAVIAYLNNGNDF